MEQRTLTIGIAFVGGAWLDDWGHDWTAVIGPMVPQEYEQSDSPLLEVEFRWYQGDPREYRKVSVYQGDWEPVANSWRFIRRPEPLFVTNERLHPGGILCNYYEDEIQEVENS